MAVSMEIITGKSLKLSTCHRAKLEFDSKKPNQAWCSKCGKSAEFPSLARRV